MNHIRGISTAFRKKASLSFFALIFMLAALFWPELAAAQDSGGALEGLRDIVADEEAPAFNARILQLFFLVTVLSLAPAIAMMITCLPFMIIVFSFLRQAIGLQQSPPNMMIMGLDG